jgi:hypothetical protein
VWATDCPLAALQFQQHAGRKPMHPMSILARAYRADGFETKLAPPSASGSAESSPPGSGSTGSGSTGSGSTATPGRNDPDGGR